MDRAPDVLSAQGRRGDAGRGHRSGRQALPGDRRSCRPRMVDRSDGIAVGGRKPVGACVTIGDVITGLAHTAVCVPDCEAAVAFYRDVLGLTVLSPPYVMEGDAIRADMGELLPEPAMKAAIVGFSDDGDRVLEVIEYLQADGGDGRRTAGLADHGLTHVGLIC